MCWNYREVIKRTRIWFLFTFSLSSSFLKVSVFVHKMTKSKVQNLGTPREVPIRTLHVCFKAHGYDISYLFLIFVLLFSSFKNYFRDGWNVFDFVIVLGSLLDFGLQKGMVRTNSRLAF